MRGLIAFAVAVLSLACATAPAHAAVTVSSAQTQNMSCSSGVCAPTATTAVLNVGDLENLLASGGVTVTTTGSGVQAKDINVNAPLTWSTSNVLSLDAYDSIAVDKAISVAGAGGLSIATGNGGRKGTLSFGPKGSVGFVNLSDPLSINGAAFTLVNSVAALASAIASNPGGNYALANNYDASQDGTYSNSPVTTTLTGTVQGLGNTIANLSIDYHQTGRGGFVIGMFAQVANSGAVANLRLDNINFTASQVLHATGGIGGLVGGNFGTLFGDVVAGSIKTASCCSIGGLVYANSGTITSSSTKVRIKTKGSFAGGLVAGSSGSIGLSHADGSVIGVTSGGLVGIQGNGTISQSFATGKVEGEIPGGLVGEIEQNGMIENSYSTGAVSGTSIGGFVSNSQSGPAISSSYSTGAVPSGGGGFGCIVYESDISADYWDTTTSGTTDGVCNGNIDGITGLTTEQLQSGLPAGFDPKLWAEDPNINGGLPYLINNPPPKK